MHPIEELRHVHDAIATRERARANELAALFPGDGSSDWTTYDEALTTFNIERADELAELLRLASRVLGTRP
ncbi:hypothetical protein ACX31A_15260 [Dermacoccus nishinomiyaensis]